MADTLRYHFPQEPCSDCGQVGQVCFKHWGPLVLDNEVGLFCQICWRKRVDDYHCGNPPRPLGGMMCGACGGSGQRFVVDRVVQGQSYGPETEGHYERCSECGGRSST